MIATRSIHVWMPNGRSLCDRVALAKAHVGGEEAIKDPACGACLLLVSYVRRRAAGILQLADGVTPDLPSEAWQSLRGTHWASTMDLDEFATRKDTDAGSRYDAFMLAVDSTSVDRLIGEWRQGL